MGNIMAHVWMNRGVALLALLALVASSFFLLKGDTQKTFALRISGGDVEGRRHALAEALASAGNAHRLAIEVVPTAGSGEALDMVSAGQLDAALVQGGLPPQPGVLEVVPVSVEPLHLLAKKELAPGGLPALKGRRLNLSTRGSGTRQLAIEALAFAGFEPGRDFEEAEFSYGELEGMKYEELPDGMFMVSTLPSPIAETLATRFGYQLVPLPFARSMSLRRVAIVEGTIPAFTYGIVPPSPAEDIPTIGTNLLLVANESVPREAVVRLIEALHDGQFARTTNVAPASLDGGIPSPELPLHEGTLSYLKRNHPLLRSELIDNIESLRSFIVSVAIALFLLWRWWERRKAIGFERYIDQATKIEREILELETQARLDLEELLRRRQRITELKADALERFAEGNIKGEELMASFLAHVTDIREHLNALILHERTRIEKQAARSGTEGQKLDALWTAAVGDFVSESDEPPKP